MAGRAAGQGRVVRSPGGAMGGAGARGRAGRVCWFPRTGHGGGLVEKRAKFIAVEVPLSVPCSPRLARAEPGRLRTYHARAVHGGRNTPPAVGFGDPPPNCIQSSI